MEKHKCISFGSSFMVQRYISSDYSRLFDIWERAVKKTHHFLSQESYEHIRLILPNYFQKVEIYVYKKAGKDVAFMGVRDDKLEMLFCDPDYFRQGIGSFMINYALNFLNIKYVDVNEQNQSAIEFYKHHGFKEIARTTSDNFGYPILHLAHESGM